MRSEENPLDLNNFPEDGAVTVDSSAGGKVYQCRFCSHKFYKSQALGGHMNRHRQERETETLNRARQLVFSTDSFAPQTFHHHGGQPVLQGALYHQNLSMGDPNLIYRPLYPHQPSYQPFLSQSPPRFISYSSQYSPPPQYEYLVGQVVYGDTPNLPTPLPTDTNYTCIGAPIGHAFPTTSGGHRVSDMAASANGRGDIFQMKL